MGLFSKPDATLKRQLQAGRMALGLPSPLGEEAKLNQIVNQIHRAATPVVAKSGKAEAARIINEGRTPDRPGAQTDLWHEMLDTVLANL